MNVVDSDVRPADGADDVGRPIPNSLHAVSMALPRWRDVVGYEEKRPEVMDRLTSGYPRFLVHPLVLALGRALGGGRPCLPFPSRARRPVGGGVRHPFERRARQGRHQGGRHGGGDERIPATRR